MNKEIFEKLRRIYDKSDEEGRVLMKKEFPELTESEDEKIRKAIIEEFQVRSIGGQENKYFRNGVKIKDILAWLEKQGEKLPKSKQDWSEEDEKMKSLIISTLTSMGTLNLERYHHMNLDEVKNWLKSIKPQNHWKPSEEQLMGMEIAINVLTDNKIYVAAGHLKSIYNNLKKL